MNNKKAVYLNEKWPESNKVDGVRYELRTESRSGSWFMVKYTADELRTAIQAVKNAGEKIVSCTRCECIPGTALIKQTPIIPETRQEKTDRENRDRCRHISRELDEYAAGNVRCCPECGENIHRQDWDSVGDKFKCPECGAVVDSSDLETLSAYDMAMGDCLDIEYRVSGRAQDAYRSCRIMVAFGGPNIYIDTATKTVELRWWTDRASYPISDIVADELDEYAETMWSCQ